MKLSIKSGFVHLVLAATLVGATACGSDSATGVSATPAQFRIVNSVFQYTDGTSTASKTTPVAIDVLVDSSTSAPGLAAIPANSIAPAAGSSVFEALNPATHTFVARLAGDTGPTSSFYTALTDSLPYLPHQYVTSGTPYTLVVAGIVPATPAGAPHTRVPAPAVPFTVITNDPFPPPLVSGAYQARFVVINAAPFTSVTGLGSTLLVYLTPGTTAPTTVTGLTSSGGVLYRSASVYINANPGPYVLTLVVSSKIVAQTAITLGAGEVRSYIVQSTGYAAVPSPANSVVRSLLDHQY